MEDMQNFYTIGGCRDENHGACSLCQTGVDNQRLPAPFPGRQRQAINPCLCNPSSVITRKATAGSTDPNAIPNTEAHFYDGSLNSINLGFADGHVETHNRGSIGWQFTACNQAIIIESFLTNMETMTKISHCRILHENHSFINSQTVVNK